MQPVLHTERTGLELVVAKDSQMMKLTYGRLTEDPTKHLVGPSKDTIQVPDSLSGFTFPLLLIEHDELGKVPFLYCEYSESREDGTYESIELVSTGGGWSLAKESGERILEFIEEVSMDPLDDPREWRKPYLELSSMEAPGAPEEVRRTIRKRDSSVGSGNFPLVDAKPVWIQNPSTPLDASGRPLRFVAQVGATYLTRYAADFEFYLFHDDESGNFLQVAQWS